MKSGDLELNCQTKLQRIAAAGIEKRRRVTQSKARSKGQLRCLCDCENWESVPGECLWQHPDQSKSELMKSMRDCLL
jgi:hypothetical protein